MDEEIKMIEKNHTWELMQKPEDKEIIGLKWVYKIKYNEDGTIKNPQIKNPKSQFKNPQNKNP